MAAQILDSPELLMMAAQRDNEVLLPLLLVPLSSPYSPNPIFPIVSNRQPRVYRRPVYDICACSAASSRPPRSPSAAVSLPRAWLAGLRRAAPLGRRLGDRFAGPEGWTWLGEDGCGVLEEERGISC